MSSNSHHPPHQLVVADDHEIIAHGIESFQNLFLEMHRPGNSEEFAAFRQLFNGTLTTHFAYEEREVFPVILADDPPPSMRQTINQLIEDHVRLLFKAQRVNTLLARQDLSTSTGELQETLRDFLEDLQKHAAKEDLLFDRKVV